MIAFGANPVPWIVTGDPAINVAEPLLDGIESGALDGGGESGSDGAPIAEHTNTAVARQIPVSGLPYDTQ
jgi:hypothetical protein